MNGALTHLQDYWSAGGPLLGLIAIVCLLLWICFLRSNELLSRTLREGRSVGDALEQRGRGASGPAALIAFMEAQRGGVASMLGSALKEIRAGRSPAAAFSRYDEACSALLQRDFLLVAVFTTVAPLLGLLGTVTGMVETFDAVAALTGGTGGRVAAGISRALITTQFGLIVALPGVFGLSRLRRLLRDIEVQIAACRAYLLDMLEAANRGESR